MWEGMVLVQNSKIVQNLNARTGNIKDMVLVQNLNARTGNIKGMVLVQNKNAKLMADIILKSA